jgi:hypothetical protein
LTAPQKGPKSRILVVENHKPTRRIVFESNVRLITILMIIIFGWLILKQTIKLLRVIVSMTFKTPEFYLHPSSQLMEIVLFIILSIMGIFVLLQYYIVFSRTAVPKPIQWRSLTKYAPAVFIGVAFFVSAFYLYADICRISAGVQSNSFVLQTNLRKEPFTSKKFALIGATKNHYYLRDANGITTIKADDVLFLREQKINNLDTWDPIERWDLPPYAIYPPSLQKR